LPSGFGSRQRPSGTGVYRKYGFESSPVDEFHLYLLMKDIKASLGSSP
jgi:hypothetical protein